MAEIQHEELTQEQAQRPKKSVFRSIFRVLWRVVAALLTLLLIAGAVYLVIHRDEVNSDAIRRYFVYHSVKSGNDADELEFTADTTGAMAVLDRGLLICSKTELTLVGKNGSQLIQETVKFEKPMIDVSGDYAVAYDAGGSVVYLISSGDIVQTYYPADGQLILSARVNEKGSVTIVEQANGYKAAVTVYTKTMSPILTENISSAFVTDALLSPDGEQLAVVCIDENAEGFESAVTFYRTSDGEVLYRTPIGSDMPLDMAWKGERDLWIVGEYGAYEISSGVITHSYVDSTQFLRGYSLGGSDYALLYYTRYQSGTSGSMTTVNENGTERSIGIGEDILSVAAEGDYIAVLTASELTVYNSELTACASTLNTVGARRVLMRDDGAVLLVAASTATLFVPE